MTFLIIAAVAVLIYAIGHGRGRRSGHEDSIARAVSDLLTRTRGGGL